MNIRYIYIYIYADLYIYIYISSESRRFFSPKKGGFVWTKKNCCDFYWTKKSSHDHLSEIWKGFNTRIMRSILLDRSRSKKLCMYTSYKERTFPIHHFFRGRNVSFRECKLCTMYQGFLHPGWFAGFVNHQQHQSYNVVACP